MVFLLFIKKKWEEKMCNKDLIREYEMPRTGVDPEEVLVLCRPHMEQLYGGTPREGWLQYVFRRLLAGYFPENFSVPEDGGGSDKGENPPEESQGGQEAVSYFIEVLNGLLEREGRELPFDPCRNFALLTKKEEKYCSILSEYKRFRECVGRKGVYAFMRLSQICTPYQTLGHIAGVHHVSMYMARQLAKKGVPVDLGLMSGAALMHDIGKYGCRPEEGRRVPYLHYYYTYQFCRNNHLKSIGTIAANHSVWDLELENLSAESLLLIYADFRVKSVYDQSGREQIRFWSLAEAYDVILGKLDDVDAAKKRRYARVYAKLKDFEDYMLSLGCSVDLTSPAGEPAKRNFASLMSAGEIVERFKSLAIRANLQIMSTTTREEQFMSLLENIRAERDWRHVRAYLTAIEEYSAYLPQNQKRVILNFLFDMLSHRDGDIRRQAAAIAGVLIAGYEIAFTKEIPHGYHPPKIGRSMTRVFQDFLERLLHPEVHAEERERRYAGFAMQTVLHTLLERLNEEKQKHILEVYISKCHSGYDSLTTFFLMDGSAEIKYSLCGKKQVERLASFAYTLLSGEAGEENQAAALRFILLWMEQGWKPEKNISELIEKSIPDVRQKPYSVQFVIARIREKFYGVPSEQGMIYYDLTRLYMENQRSEVSRIYKYINLEILRKRQGEETSQEQLYQYASHLLHMLQFSGHIVNRFQASNNLLAIIPLLSETQCHEIVLELMQALEIEEYAVSKYIPPCLGQMFSLLGKEERKYILGQLRKLCCAVRSRTVIAVLETAGKILHNCSGKLSARERTLTEGILFIGMADYRDEIAQEAFYITGYELFADGGLSLEEKRRYFSIFARKILTLMNWDRLGLYVYFNGAALNRIYRFINDYILKEGKHPFEEKKLPTAFFPGTFDPFSLGHKQIVEKIRAMGFRVYLAVDEFSWSKKPQPFEVRRKILSMSTADMEDVYLFPKEIPINIANPEDMKTLSRVFPETQVYMVVGSDVVNNASAYRKASEKDSVHYFPHIIFSRNVSDPESRDEAALCRERIFGEKCYMKLPPLLEQVSSTKIRENINAGKDILGLVDECAQNYIYNLGLYTIDPIYKKTARFLHVDTRLQEEGEGAWRMYISNQGAASSSVDFHDVNFSDLMRECADIEQAGILRKLLFGRTAMITRIEGMVSPLEDGRLTALNEVLEYFQENSYSFALCRDTGENQEVLKLHGFCPVEGIENLLFLDLRQPLVLFYDTPSSIKEPMVESDAVRLALRKSHLRLLRVLTGLYPGRLILCFSSDIMNYRLIRLITEENHVEFTPNPAGGLGEKMCVPFGKVLKGVKIPNTVTKGLETERVYKKDISSYSISNFPGYAPLPVQIRTIRSFRKPVLLVDDLYHSGRRMQAIAGEMKREGIEDTELIVGVISGRGQDLARVSGHKVKAVYNVPNLSSWLIESDLYPFIGGDGVEEKKKALDQIMAIPSVNPILPYEAPSYLAGVSLGAFYELSRVCIENARDIYKVLEKEYRRQYGRQLTMDRIGEVLAEPRYPDSIGLSREKLQQSPSRILEEELERLRRLQALAKMV